MKASKVFLASLFLFYGLDSLAQESKNSQLDKSVDISTNSINSGASNQERLNKLDDETRLLEFDYKDTIKEYENLKLYNDQLLFYHVELFLIDKLQLKKTKNQFFLKKGLYGCQPNQDQIGEQEFFQKLVHYQQNTLILLIRNYSKNF